MTTIANNLYANLPAELPNESFNTLLKHHHARIERIVSKGHATPDGQWFNQDRDEWVILLQGQAIISYEQSFPPIHLMPGDFIFIPAHTKHRVDWTPHEETTIWLAVHLDQEAV